ncbi:DUF4244 domain-containing protein [Streptomyces sp. A7024]|uniref:DUF4244 domain-containing protein n=1 Tax=Streptomyces coryli TaxID=1128680 RepID=A0A6G4UA96_9ACTN|nr:DUF4244 domain-containing protein [Streptomyces coryli]
MSFNGCAGFRSAGFRRGWRGLVARVAAQVRGRGGDAGMTTSEYAVGTIAAVAFAAVLYKVVTSGAVSSALQGIVERALDVPF